MEGVENQSLHRYESLKHNLAVQMPQADLLSSTTLHQLLDLNEKELAAFEYDLSKVYDCLVQFQFRQGEFLEDLDRRTWMAEQIASLQLKVNKASASLDELRRHRHTQVAQLYLDAQKAVEARIPKVVNYARLREQRAEKENKIGKAKKRRNLIGVGVMLVGLVLPLIVYMVVSRRVPVV